MGIHRRYIEWNDRMKVESPVRPSAELLPGGHRRLRRSSQTFDLLGADVKLSGALTTGRLRIGCWVSLQTPSATSVLFWRVRYDRNQLWGHSGLDLTHLYQNKRQKNHHESTCDALDHFYFEKPLQNSATLRPALDACDWVEFRLMHDSRGTIID